MRELKFKVWTGKEMIGPFDLSQHPMYWADKLQDGERLLFTGLKDKDGTEIYEGNILHINKAFNGVDIFGKVYWKGAGFAMITKRGSDTSQGYFEIVTPYTKIIGNIYENPESMEEQK